VTRLVVLGREEIEGLVAHDALLDALSDAFVAVSAGTVSMPPRIAARVDDRDGLLFAMPAYLPGVGLGAKLVSLFPLNAGTGVETHHALVLAFDPATGAPRAVLDGGSITALRTAGGSALSTRLLARPDSRVLGILGTGVQARAHLRAVARVRAFTDVLVWGRDAGRAGRFADDAGALVPHLGVRAVPDLDEVFAVADVICAATHADEPVVRGAALRPGTHVTSVGYNRAGREVDAEAVVRSRLFVEARAAALAPYPAGSNDLLWPVRDGVLPGPPEVVELGEVLQGVAGRTSDSEITLYKSVGIAAEDVAAAAVALAAAEREGRGQPIDL
jgi:alanine dehydrogenase